MFKYMIRRTVEQQQKIIDYLYSIAGSVTSNTTPFQKRAEAIQKDNDRLFPLREPPMQVTVEQIQQINQSIDGLLTHQRLFEQFVQQEHQTKTHIFFLMEEEALPSVVQFELDQYEILVQKLRNTFHLINQTVETLREYSVLLSSYENGLLHAVTFSFDGCETFIQHVKNYCLQTSITFHDCDTIETEEEEDDDAQKEEKEDDDAENAKGPTVSPRFLLAGCVAVLIKEQKD